MSTGSTAILASAILDDDACEDLLRRIERRGVASIRGPALRRLALAKG